MVGGKLEEFGCLKYVAELTEPSWARGVLEHRYRQLPDFQLQVPDLTFTPRCN